MTRKKGLSLKKWRKEVTLGAWKSTIVEMIFLLDLKLNTRWCFVSDVVYIWSHCLRMSQPWQASKDFPWKSVAKSKESITQVIILLSNSHRKKLCWPDGVYFWSHCCWMSQPWQASRAFPWKSDAKMSCLQLWKSITAEMVFLMDKKLNSKWCFDRNGV